VRKNVDIRVFKDKKTADNNVNTPTPDLLLHMDKLGLVTTDAAVTQKQLRNFVLDIKRKHGKVFINYALINENYETEAYTADFSTALKYLPVNLLR
jgi:hypothetical protein